MAVRKKISQGRTRPLTFVFIGRTGSPEPLAGASVSLTLSYENDTENVLARDLACVVESGPALQGRVRWEPGATLDCKPGPYLAQFKVTFVDGSVDLIPFPGELVLEVTNALRVTD